MLRRTAARRAGAAAAQRPAKFHAARVESTKPAAAGELSLSLATCVYGAAPPKEGGAWANVDGQRREDGRYAAFRRSVEAAGIPSSRVIWDPIRTFAYGTDASFYRLNPKVVVKVHDEAEVQLCIAAARAHNTPVTFRAAGTSLSGQAVTDSVLIKLSHNARHWRGYEIDERAERITLQPGLIGGEVNRLLLQFTRRRGLPQKKIGPDPASIDSCMIGGIINNNSSGMCCGVKQNTYHTLEDLRCVFWDGTVLDTADAESRQRFVEAKPELVRGIAALAERVQADSDLVALIKRKFSIKNTTGYSINALVDFPPSDPIEIIKRLIVGSEGTLAFVSRGTYRTVPDHPHKEAAFLMFPDMASACNATAALRTKTSVDAVELFDWASLKQGEADVDFRSIVKGVEGVPDGAAGLLVEVRGESPAALDDNRKTVLRVLSEAGVPFLNHGDAVDINSNGFLKSPTQQAVLWDMRKGLIPKVGAQRAPGSTMLIEDVACPIHSLAQMNLDLIDMFKRHGYDDACVFGHALEGNMHLVFSQAFQTDADVLQYSRMMEDMCRIVAETHSGSLKGEHGTGRNVAPFVEMEWGSKAYSLMWEIKRLFDPNFLLNPSVLLNNDKNCHQKALKPMPLVDPLVDRCIECGFCESNCPSRDLSLTPRQRITVMREISRLSDPSAHPSELPRLKTMVAAAPYLVEETCAADGMCQEKCPVGINTGELVKKLRAVKLEGPQAPAWQRRAAAAVSERFSAAMVAGRVALRGAAALRAVVGDRGMEAVSAAARRLFGTWVPVWNPELPPVAPKLPAVSAALGPKVVYLPSCVCRVMGPPSGCVSAPDAFVSILTKAGFGVVYPDGVDGLCCGMAFNSRGFKSVGEAKQAELVKALLRASEGGKLPIVCETSPCVQTALALSPELRVYDVMRFVSEHAADRLQWRKVRKTVAVHVPCSSKKMKLQPVFADLAGRCADEIVDSNVPCCGMAGDRGMRYPELTGASLKHLEHGGCSAGFSTSRACEMGLSQHSGITWNSLAALVDEATSPKPFSLTNRARSA